MPMVNLPARLPQGESHGFVIHACAELYRLFVSPNVWRLDVRTTQARRVSSHTISWPPPFLAMPALVGVPRCKDARAAAARSPAIRLAAASLCADEGASAVSPW